MLRRDRNDEYGPKLAREQGLTYGANELALKLMVYYGTSVLWW